MSKLNGNHKISMRFVWSTKVLNIEIDITIYENYSYLFNWKCSRSIF